MLQTVNEDDANGLVSRTDDNSGEDGSSSSSASGDDWAVHFFVSWPFIALY